MIAHVLQRQVQHRVNGEEGKLWPLFSCDYSDCTSKEMYDHTGCNCFADHQAQVIMEWRRKGGGGGWGVRELPPLSFFSPLLALLLVLVLVTNLVLVTHLVMVASEQA